MDDEGKGLERCGRSAHVWIRVKMRWGVWEKGRKSWERDRERDEVAWMRLGELGFVGECVVCVC